MSADVFISYAAKDRERVAKLVEGLQQAGVSVWIDMAGIEVAAMWSKEIVSAIRECKVLLLSISPQSTESENVVKELALASERKKPIIPIYLEPAEIPETMSCHTRRKHQASSLMADSSRVCSSHASWLPKLHEMASNAAAVATMAEKAQAV